MSPFSKLMLKRAFAVGAKMNLHYRRLGLTPPFFLRKEYEFWDNKIFKKIRHSIGITSPNFFPTAGAALSDKIIGVMRKIGIRLIYGYGMTETTATISCYPDYDFEIGTVGTPLSMVDVKISDEGELLVKGPTITPGYYNNPEADAAAFTHDGYLRTGDAGFINNRGAIVLTHRKKDLFKTSNAKCIAPQTIEAIMVSDMYIDQAAIIGDMRKYVTALIVPDFANLRRWAEKNGIISLSKDSLVKDPKVLDFYHDRIEKLQKKLAPFEHIKKFTLLTEQFSQEAGEITNTLKLRRQIIEKRYSEQINAMYPDEYLQDDPVFNNSHR